MLHLCTKFEECSFIRYRDIEGVPKFLNWARSQGHTHLGANFWSAGKNNPGSTCTANLRSIASSDRQILSGSRNFEIGYVPQATPTWGQFVVRVQEQPRIHVHTKFEECSFIRYRDIEGSRNFEIGHVPQATPTWGPISGLRARIAQDPRAHQI